MWYMSAIKGAVYLIVFILSVSKPIPPKIGEALDSNSQPCWESHTDQIRSRLRIRTLDRKAEHDKPRLASANYLQSVGDRLLEVSEKLTYTTSLIYQCRQQLF